MKRLTRLLAIAFSAILLSAFVPAHALSNFGRTTIGGITSSGLRADFKRGSKFVLSEKAVMVRICAFIDGKGGGSGSQTCASRCTGIETEHLRSRFSKATTLDSRRFGTRSGRAVKRPERRSNQALTG